MNVSRPYQQRSRLHVRFPRRELSPLRRACLSLGLEVDAQPDTNLSWLLRKAKLGKTEAISEILRRRKGASDRRSIRFIEFDRTQSRDD